MPVFKKNNRKGNTYNAKNLLIVPEKGLMSFYEKTENHAKKIYDAVYKRKAKKNHQNNVNSLLEYSSRKVV